MSKFCTAKAGWQFLCGAAPCILWSDPSLSQSRFSLVSHGIHAKRRASMKGKVSNFTSPLLGHAGLQGIACNSSGKKPMKRLKVVNCNNQNSDSLSGVAEKDMNENWFIHNTEDLNPLTQTVKGRGFEQVQQRIENDAFMLNRNGASNSKSSSIVDKTNVDSVEDEAWDLLRESIVHYCGSPVGTIAANDPNSSNVLNYDQVFRDFIPSGIAFLLKGEYEIVRNFILHTLQLQVLILFMLLLLLVPLKLRAYSELFFSR